MSGHTILHQPDVKPADTANSSDTTAAVPRHRLPEDSAQLWSCPTCGGHKPPLAWRGVTKEWKSLTDRERKVAGGLLELIHSSHETASGLPDVLRVLLPSLSDIESGLDPDYFLLGFNVASRGDTVDGPHLQL